MGGEGGGGQVCVQRGVCEWEGREGEGKCVCRGKGSMLVEGEGQEGEGKCVCRGKESVSWGGEGGGGQVCVQREGECELGRGGKGGGGQFQVCVQWEERWKWECWPVRGATGSVID